MPLTASGIVRPTSLMVTPFSFESTSLQGLFSGRGAGTNSTAWGTANRALYVPIVLQQAATFVYAFWGNGGTVSGNVDVGIYDAAWTLITSTGSTAMSGTNTLQGVDIADITLQPGRYYLAFVASSGTATFAMSVIPDAMRLPAMGYAQEASALPLPATATPAVATHLNVPMFGLSRRTLL